MRPTLALLRAEPRARRFFAAHAQSSLGTGAAYVALLVVAYDRFRSPWAITLILLAEFLPGMVLGPVLGAVADRRSRRACAIVADLARAGAFVGLGLVGGFVPTLALALIAGAGTTLYKPAILAALPGIARGERSAAATALYGALTDLGFTVGPAIAGLALLVAGADTVLIVNGLTFAISALVLATLDFGAVPAGDGAMPAGDAASRPRDASLLRSAADGLRATLERPGVRLVVLSAGVVVLFAGLFNVGELLLAREELGVGGAGFSILVAVYGSCVAIGSMVGARGGEIAELTRRYTLGVLLVGVGMLSSGVAPSYGVAVATFAATGLGNGLIVVHERLLVQQTVPGGQLARVFGFQETLVSWGFCLSFVSGGALASALGTRELFLVAGSGALLLWALTAAVIARAFQAGQPTDVPAPQLYATAARPGGSVAEDRGEVARIS